MTDTLQDRLRETAEELRKNDFLFLGLEVREAADRIDALESQVAALMRQTVLPPNCAGVILDPRGEVTLCLPDKDDDAEVPESFLILAAFVAHLPDPDFRAAMMGHFEEYGEGGE